MCLIVCERFFRVVFGAFENTSFREDGHALTVESFHLSDDNTDVLQIGWVSQDVEDECYLLDFNLITDKGRILGPYGGPEDLQTSDMSQVASKDTWDEQEPLMALGWLKERHRVKVALSRAAQRIS
ncbi:hypothetical protein ACSYDW_14520 [Paeniglutamicibacter sp. R2-26]|uniref:hypothetical protein n=1 Tax=Paeniglutamicibacter sp. R2-26 TaxID=3144417 RepID=UPI003EE6EABF